jgi:hypothetical protein
MISSYPKKFRGGAKPTDAQEIIQVLMTYRQQLHIYHWQTQSYARHKASDELLGKLSDFIDKFMEIYFGKYGKVNITVPIIIKLENMNDAQAVTYLDVMMAYFEDALPVYLDAKDTDLVNLRDEVLAGVKQTKYLYTLQ